MGMMFKTKFFAAFATLALMGFSSGASAAIFDTIDSVETLQKIAAQNQEKKADRMPAGQETKENDTKKTEVEKKD